MSHRLLLNSPERYHGTKKSRPYFEGWYFKHVSGEKDFSIAVIPGIYRGKNPADDHSFIQILHNNKSYFIEFAADEFQYSSDSFDIKIGNNHFSIKGMTLDIKNSDINISADISYVNHLLLKTNWISPSIMGPFSYFPGMQCNHGVLSLDNDIYGHFIINGLKISTEGFRGYIEKDWGEAFPSSWLWLQCNSRDNDDVSSCMCSVATIPYAFLRFNGFIAVVAVNGKQYRFTTYNFSRVVRLSKTENRVELVLRRFSLQLDVTAIAHNSTILKAPAATGMDRDIMESLNASVSVRLSRRGITIYKETHEMGGLEISEIGSIIKEK